MMKKTKPSKTITETAVEWNEELTFMGVDLDTTPQLELKLMGIRGSIKSKIQSSMQNMVALHKQMADVRVNLAGVVDSGGHMQQLWQDCPFTHTFTFTLSYCI